MAANAPVTTTKAASPERCGSCTFRLEMLLFVFAQWLLADPERVQARPVVGPTWRLAASYSKFHLLREREGSASSPDSLDPVEGVALATLVIPALPFRYSLLKTSAAVRHTEAHTLPKAHPASTSLG